MKTFLAVALYTVVVIALDLGGAVWTGQHRVLSVRDAMLTAAMSAKASHAVQPLGTIPSDT